MPTIGGKIGCRRLKCRICCRLDLARPACGGRGRNPDRHRHPATNWSNLAAEWRKLRRSVDAFIYEPVFAGTFEDAFCAAMLNPDLAAVIVNEGFAQHSRHNAPVLRSLMASMERQEMSNSALALARTLKRIRPELDVYLVSNQNVEELAGNPEADVVRRIFYSVEELLELHLAILEGIQDRWKRPSSTISRSTPSARSGRSTRCHRPWQVRIQVGLDSIWRLLRSKPFPRREQRDHGRSRQPAQPPAT